MRQSRLNRAPTVQTKAVTVASGEAAIARGEHLAKSGACLACHGQTLAGTEVVNAAPNLTSSGVGASYNDEEWERAIRHDIAKDGRVITIMSSDHYARYGDDDLVTLIAYLESVSPAENRLPARSLQFPGTIIFELLAYNSWAVNKIDADSHKVPTSRLGAKSKAGRFRILLRHCAMG